MSEGKPGGDASKKPKRAGKSAVTATTARKPSAGAGTTDKAPARKPAAAKSPGKKPAAKTEATKTEAAKTEVTKTTAPRRKPAVPAKPALDAELRQRLINDTAYYLSEKRRQFVSAEDDWCFAAGLVDGLTGALLKK